MADVIAILVADIHLSHKAPIVRSAEPDWYAAMKRPLDELKALSAHDAAPIICAGDVFDKWNSPPELINFAIDHLPKMYGIPGQHDLPNHRIDEIGRSAYWTLVKAGIITPIEPSPHGTQHGRLLSMYGSPWGEEIVYPARGDHAEGRIWLAVVHSYIWKEKFGYPGADENQKVHKYQESLERYSAAVFGDNHMGFIVGRQSHSQMIMNCGTLMRRKIDEFDYRPQVGLLYSNGNIEPHFLDTSKDLFIEEPLARAKEEQELDVSRFLQELRELGSDSLDFRDAANRYMDGKKVDEDIRTLVLESIG